MFDDPDPLEEAKLFLWEQRNSAHFKAYLKIIEHMYEKEASRLVNADPAMLLRHQGILMGLNLAKALMTQAKIPE
jgi:hypothetical protein